MYRCQACGLVKNLALMTHITTDDEEAPIVRCDHICVELGRDFKDCYVQAGIQSWRGGCLAAVWR